ncbi:hypothetical protein D3C76_779020 [compost metagenome]
MGSDPLLVEGVVADRRHPATQVQALHPIRQMVVGPEGQGVARDRIEFRVVITGFLLDIGKGITRHDHPVLTQIAGRLQLHPLGVDLASRPVGIGNGDPLLVIGLGRDVIVLHQEGGRSGVELAIQQG